MDIDLTHNGVGISVLDGPYIEGGQLTGGAIVDYTELVARLGEVKAHAADILLDLYNSTWRTDEIGELNREHFIARLSNPTANMFEPGFAIAYFEDGNMFAGHAIEVHIENGIPTHASIAG